MSAPRLATSRRTALGGAVAGLVAVSGCEDEPGRAPTPGAATMSGVGDTALVDELIELMAETAALVALARESHRDLRPTLRPLAEVHVAHQEALDPDGVAAAGSTGPTGLPQVRRAEAILQRHLTDAAIAAESCALAALLASMAAAIAQHLAVLP